MELEKIFMHQIRQLTVLELQEEAINLGHTSVDSIPTYYSKIKLFDIVYYIL